GMTEPPEFGPGAMRALAEYSWPGNVRELKNVVERSVYRSGGARIDRIEFDPFVNPYENAESRPRPSSEGRSASARERLSLAERTRELELQCLREALLECRHRQSEAAALLGLSYHQFRGLYRKYKDELRG